MSPLAPDPVPPDIPAPADDLYDALDARLALRGLYQVFHDGLITGEVPPQVSFPYLILDPLGETPIVTTNGGRYDSVMVQLAAYDRTFKRARQAIALVVPAVLMAPLAIVGGRVLHLLPGPVRFDRDGHAWRALAQFRGATGKPFERFPG